MARIFKAVLWLIACVCLIVFGMAMQEPLSAAGISISESWDKYMTHVLAFIIGGATGCVIGWFAGRFREQVA